MPRFLPKSVKDYAISGRAGADFTHAAATLLDDIGRKMSVDKARSEGRIPSPFSRSFIFYLNLHGKGLRTESSSGNEEERLDRGRELLQAEARRTFRGLCAAFALRKVLALNIRQTGVLLNPAGRRLERALAATVEAAPRGKDYWNPLRFYTIQQGPDDAQEVLAGLSPLTVLAPPARQPRRLSALFWYDPGDPETRQPARWYDPTSLELSEDNSLQLRNPLASQKIRRLMRAWLTRAVPSTSKPSALQAFGVEPPDCKLLHNELKSWLAQLGGELREDGLVEAEAIPTDAGGAASPAFLEYACHATAEELLGDLPMFRGRLLVTREQLLDPAVRLYGRTFGQPSRDDAVGRLPRHGDNLGAALGLGTDRIPLGYLLVDQLFATRLTMVTEGGFSEQWKGLEIEGEHYLLPFRPEILDLLSPEELVAAVSGQRDRRGDQVIIALRFGDVEIPQLYATSGEGEYVVDSVTIPPEHLDIRVFPNFDLDSVRDGPGSSPLPLEDRKYYARVRVSPLWKFQIRPFRYDAVTRSVVTNMADEVRLGDARSHGDPKQFHPGQVLLFAMAEKPSGFSVEDRGLCLVSFPVATGSPAVWEVGVDFGTSNTCVTYRTAADEVPKILPFPVLTTTLLREPRYSAEFRRPDGPAAAEGASALLDFFFKQQSTDASLTPNDYFPTQLVTRHTDIQPKWAWDHEGGLIFFKNVSLANPIVWELIDRFPDPDQERKPRHRKAFRLKQDIKWEQTRWLKVFMQHLRRQVLMAAARERGIVQRVHFSYPKAFSFTQKEEFFEVLDEVWNPSGASDTIFKASESEAVRNYIIREANEYVVFDVGGGTTDLLGFSTHEPIFQTSFKLAAGHINRFVIQSAAFRNAFLDAFTDKIGVTLSPSMVRDFTAAADAADPDLLATVWLGLLELVEQNDPSGRKMMEILGVLRRKQGDVKEPEVRAVQGFFLTLSLLFGGLAYYAGVLMRAASDGKFDGQTFERRLVELVLTGNGAKLFNMLDHREAPFTPVIQGMFLTGMAAGDEEPPTRLGRGDLEHVRFEGIFRLRDRAAPKVTVALGLLKASSAGESAEQQPIPLANLLGEDGYTIGGETAKYDGGLVAFYREVEGGLRGFNPPASPPPQLRRCLEALNRLLPNGINQGMPVIPRAGTDWHRDLLDRLYALSAPHIRNRVVRNARVLATDLKNARITETDIPAQEPLFIVELAALLDQIRGEYA